MSLRLLVTLPFFAARFGGSVAQAQLRCRALAQRGHDVSLLTSDLLLPAELPRQRWFDHDGYRVFAACTARRHALPPYLAPRSFARELDARLAHVDLLCIHVGLTLGGALAARSARAAAVPYVYNAEGALDPVRLRQKALGKALFLRLCERPLLRGAAAVQALTADDAGFAARQGADRRRIHVIPNMVDAARWAAPADGQGFRARHALPRDAVVVLFAGRLHALKGLDLLLAALLPRLRARPELLLVVAGPDDGAGAPLRREAEAAGVAPQVRCLGELPPDELPAAFAAADLFALLSRSEGLPVAALEAAAAGLPLWLSDACRLPEVQEFGAGAVATGDVAALQSAVLPLLDDAGHRRRCGQNAARMVRERFAIDAIAPRLEALYQSLVVGRKDTPPPRAAAPHG